MTSDTTRLTALAAGALLLCACGPTPRTARPAPAPEPGLAIAAPMTRDDFADLRWLEGTWRGAGSDPAAFWERYTFPDDSTIRVESWGDSTLAGEPETATVRLRDGRVTTGSGGALWIVTAFDERGVRFDPVAGARNSFVWTRGEDADGDGHTDEWTAVLSWPATASAPARERTYTLRRRP